MIKKSVFFLFFYLVSSVILGQSSTFQVWTETGCRGKLSKKFEYNLSLTNRFSDFNLVTFFPQLTLKYKLSDWCKPSLDYRMISDREDNGNYLLSQRLNFNLSLEKDIQRMSASIRFRYQYSFKGITSNYEPEFDNAIRVKPAISYNFKGKIIKPILSSEIFYNPSFGLYGKRVTRIRNFIGFDLNLKGPHDLQIGYFFDQKVNLPNQNNRHVLSFDYCYNLSYKSKKETTKKS